MECGVCVCMECGVYVCVCRECVCVCVCERLCVLTGWQVVSQHYRHQEQRMQTPRGKRVLGRQEGPARLQRGMQCADLEMRPESKRGSARPRGLNPRPSGAFPVCRIQHGDHMEPARGRAEVRIGGRRKWQMAPPPAPVSVEPRTRRL